MTKKNAKVINVLGEDTLAFEESYLNNPNLPKKESTYVFTDEMIREIDKCKNDIIYFAEHHFFINGMYGKEVIKLFDKQKKILRTIQSSKKTLICTSRQWGKCLSGQTNIRIRCRLLPFSIKIPVGMLFKIIKTFSKLSTYINKII